MKIIQQSKKQKDWYDIYRYSSYQKDKKLAPHEGIEPSTTSLKGWRSTAELKRQLIQFYKKFILFISFIVSEK